MTGAEDVIRRLVAQLGDAADFHFARKYVDCIVEEYAGKLATLDAGTCEADETDRIECVETVGGRHYDIHIMECTECGHTYEHVNGGYEYCPRCGRKRRDVEE